MDELELEFQLDPQLKVDTVHLGDYPLCQVLLMNDSNYPWFILVPRRAGVTEIYHLGEKDRHQLMKESASLAENLADIFAARKMNVANLGNMVAQLHVHVIVRKEGDFAWPGPVWGKAPAKSYTDEELSRIQSRLDTLLEGELEFTPA